MNTFFLLIEFIMPHSSSSASMEVNLYTQTKRNGEIKTEKFNKACKLEKSIYIDSKTCCQAVFKNEKNLFQQKNKIQDDSYKLDGVLKS